MRNSRKVIVAAILAAVGLLVALPVAWYLLSPLFINRAVNEALPTSLPAPAANFVPAEATAAMEQAMAEPTRAMDEGMPSDDMATMTIVAQGKFYNVVHEGMGNATLYQLADGSTVLRFENFEVLNGPELHVYLAPVDPVPNSIGVEIPGSADLGLLKGNVGNQNYTLPTGLDLTQFKSVVIWCQPFRVPFIAAPLKAP